MSDFGYLHHKASASGPFCTERVEITLRGWPHTGEWQARFEGRWRKVHTDGRTGWIVYQGERIRITIEGYC